ncbi:MAG: hypothetical protein HUJ74_00390 [Lachnospiraceae bacterium]|nr:hypothetical protein [Lachnospiraceae bacterium]
MNIETTVIEYLNDKGYCASASVPDPRPDEFVTVELTGGNYEVNISRPTLAIQAWSKTRLSASVLAGNLITDLQKLNVLSGIARSDINSYYHFADPDSRAERYQIVVNLVINE